MSPRLKQTLHRYLEKPPDSVGPRIVQGGIMLVILVNVAAAVLGTLRTEDGAGTIEDSYAREFFILEAVSVGIFTAEYVLRLLSITVDPRYCRPVRGRLRYALTPLAIIDLVAFFPFYLHLLIPFRGAERTLVLRALRLMRVFRLFKLGHYSGAVRSLQRAIYSKRGELVVTVFAVGILLVIASTVMYFAEYEAQPDRFSSIPATMWWGIVTLTTVGYGDLTPVTALGKAAGAVVAVFGIGLVALPAGILGSAFVEEIQRSKAATPKRCPHCGKDVS